MTKKQVLLVQQSWKVFRTIKPEYIGDLFYSKLFLLAPSIRRLFAKSMDSQYKKLIDMLSMIVGRLDHIDELTEDIRQLARRHVGYGVKFSHYQVVGEALLWTLEQGLGEEWNEHMNEAWSACYKMISDNMIQASDY